MFQFRMFQDLFELLIDKTFFITDSYPDLKITINRTTSTRIARDYATTYFIKAG
jgi:hypothetical protein